MRKASGVAAVAAVAAGGAVLGWAAERRTMGRSAPLDDPEWEELGRPVRGRPLRVESFDGTRLHVEVLGVADAPTLVLVHGYGLSQHAWHYQRRDLRDELRLVAYDQRGHAASEEAASGDYSIGALGRDLAAVVAATAGGQRVVLVGHSMGGMAILSYVEQYPETVTEHVAGAVFVSTTGSDVLAGAVVSSGIAAASAVRNRLTRRVLTAVGRRAGADDRASAASSDLSFLLTRTIGLNGAASPAHVAFTEQLLLDCPDTVKAALGPLFTSLDLRAAAPLLTAPALVLVGACDRLTPPSAARRLAGLLGDGELAELPGAGHMAVLEAHEAVTGHLRTFARRVLG